MESQSQAAQRIYNPRAFNYDDSWHPDYSKRLMELIPIKPGDKVLVLCCGTGLESFITASSVGADGVVVGVDVSANMLAEARKRQEREPELGSRIKLIQHDVTDLDSCVELRQLQAKNTFDVLICSNAFVLLEHPSEVVASWKMWLKDGGLMAIDVTHEKNLVQGMLIEKVAVDIKSYWPSNRRWIESKESFQRILEDNGMAVERVELLDKVLEKPIIEYGIGEAEEQFEFLVNSPFAMNVRWTDDEVKLAKELFKKKWEAIAQDGKVKNVDALYLYIARKS